MTEPRPTLLAEDSPEDTELTLEALGRQNLAERANVYVVKPIEFTQLIDAVNQVGVFWALTNEPPVKGRQA